MSLGSRACSRCTVSYRIEQEPANAEAYRCDCGLRYWTYDGSDDEGDYAVVATSLTEVANNMPHSGGLRAANDNQPDPVRPEVRWAYAKQVPWPFGGKTDQ